MAEISPESSARICAHMNDDHAATIHAIVTSGLSGREASCKVQNARMKSVTLKDYSISFVLCDGEACAMKEVTVPFNPPLGSSGEVRPRLIEEHHRALNPRFTWLATDPLMRVLFGSTILLGIGTWLGQEELARRVDGIPWANAIVSAGFVTSDRFARVVIGCWYFSLFAHTAEAIYTAFLCKSLKMKPLTILKWFILNVCTGFPIMKKVQELVDVDKAARSKGKSK